MLVLTYNFATAITETTTFKLQTLATELHLVSSFQNCELKQEPCTLTTELKRTHEFRGHEKTRSKHTYNRAKTNSQIPPSRKNKKSTLVTAMHYFFKHRHCFCFNSKPSFSFESRRQRITFPVASKYSCNRKRVGLESKLHPTNLFFSG